MVLLAPNLGLSYCHVDGTTLSQICGLEKDQSPTFYILPPTFFSFNPIFIFEATLIQQLVNPITFNLTILCFFHGYLIIPKHLSHSFLHGNTHFLYVTNLFLVLAYRIKENIHYIIIIFALDFWLPPKTAHPSPARRQLM